MPRTAPAVTPQLKTENANIADKLIVKAPSTTQGSKKPPSGRPGQVHFPFGQVTFSPYLPHGQGPRQVVRRLNC